jgi:hypothetical protein
MGTRNFGMTEDYPFITHSGVHEFARLDHQQSHSTASRTCAVEPSPATRDPLARAAAPTTRMSVSLTSANSETRRNLLSLLFLGTCGLTQMGRTLQYVEQFESGTQQIGECRRDPPHERPILQPDAAEDLFTGGARRRFHWTSMRRI